MGDYNPELGKQKHADIQAMNMAKLKFEFHRFCMITWENCMKYAVEIVALQEEPIEDEKVVFIMAEKVFDFIEAKADDMFEKRYPKLEQEARGNKAHNNPEFDEFLDRIKREDK
jgi:hypothetical protein